MININIVCVGTLKEQFWKDAVSEYAKRLNAYAKLNIIEVKEGNYGTCDKEIFVAKKQEAERLSKYKKGYNIALEILGKPFSSEEFAGFLSEVSITGKGIVTFFVGGSYGLDKEFSNSMNQKLTFSSLTFPHQMVRVILLEQIYRAFTILNNKTYHK